MVIDTSRILHSNPPEHIYLQFDFEKKYSPSKFERFVAQSEIQRHFSFGLSDGHFSSGSRRYFLVSLQELSLRTAARLTVWINYRRVGQNEASVLGQCSC